MIMVGDIALSFSIFEKAFLPLSIVFIPKEAIATVSLDSCLASFGCGMFLIVGQH